MTDVSSEVLDKVMGPEEREKYIPAYRKALAQKHILKRQQETLRTEIHENEKELSALSLLSGGIKAAPLFDRKLTYWDFEKEAKKHLQLNYTHPKEDAGNYWREFGRQMHKLRAVTPQAMDLHAEKTIELIEYNANPDAVSFRLWAVYDGDVKEMIDTLAVELGFVKLDGKG